MDAEEPKPVEEKGTNWLLIITIILGVLVLAFIAWFLVIPALTNDGDNLGTSNRIAAPDCSEDFYNCEDFATQAVAQVVYDACFPEFGDVHGLDGDGNGIACESLPEGEITGI